ncbi:glycoside hydrolase [Thraustotheca clavata]|uniref:Glycoside hydrolase n=1 Tax=Thraustotheca clavata TaxID=74557 RepID=A0A1V9Z1V8_9STRA|nr:glycoside hydrolase [Thraustotheca clavata]
MEVTKLFSVKDQTVLVTGGSRGIGKMISEAFVRNGAKVYISSRDKKACDQTAAELTAFGPGQCIAIPSDLGTDAGIDHLVTSLKERESKLDVLINNSGAVWGGGFEAHTEKAWHKIMDLNVKAPFFLIKRLLEIMDRNSRIINIGSVAGCLPQPDIGTFAYDTSKAAIHHLTRVLALELAPRGITVNAIAPGFVPTKMSKQISTATGLGMDELAHGVPLQRAGRDFDMAGAAIYYASPAGAWVTGTILTVDGGQIGAASAGFSGASKL